MNMFDFPKSWYIFVFIPLILFVYIPQQLFYGLSYLPYYPMKVIGKGSSYRKKHYIINEHIEQFVLQPINYLKKTKSIHRQIVLNSKSIS